MKYPFLLALACSFVLQRDSVAQDGLLVGRDGEVLGSESDPEEALGGTFGNPFAAQLQASVVSRNVFDFVIGH